MQKKLFIIISALLLAITFQVVAQDYNYAEALQKGIWFFEAQQSGVLPEWNRVEWRGDSTWNDDVTGGWFDAGDHVKFGLPMAESASMMLWAAYEYPQAFRQSGQWDEFENNLRFVLDYFVAAHQGNEIVYQVGNGGEDHGWWGVVECIEEIMQRPSYSTSASCVTGGTAAALALGAIVFDDSTYLSEAESLFSLADSVRSDDGYTASNGYYDSWSGFWDELMWAATWLYIATGDNAYLNKAESYVPELNLQGYQADDPIEYQWGHCWDDQHYGAMLLLARLTEKPLYTEFVEMHLDWWTSGYAGNRIQYTPGGLAWLDSWGALRYALNTAFLAAVYSEWVESPALSQKYYDFFVSQVNYALGSNPRNSSYVVGFGTNPPEHPHHRNAHGGWAAVMEIPSSHRHILYGAMVGGPGSSDDYSDDINNYTNNEVATDYNAGFVACMAKACADFGGTPLADFPPPETKDPELFIEALENNGYGTYTEIRFHLNNRTGWPPRVTDKLSFRFFVDLSEVFAAGFGLSDLEVKVNGEGTSASGPHQYSGDIYYVEVDYTGTKIFPGGMQYYFKEGQLKIGLTGSAVPADWDPSNDYSIRNVNVGNEFEIIREIPVYDNGILVFGEEPDGTGPVVTPTPKPATPTPPPTPTPEPLPELGDANGDGHITIIDSLMTAQASVGLNPPGIIEDNADVNGDGRLTIIDALMIAQYSVGLITEFPAS